MTNEDQECPFTDAFNVRFDNLEEDIHEIKKALLGNGQPGLLQRVTKLEGTSKVMWGIFGAIGVGIITLAARVISNLV